MSDKYYVYFYYGKNDELLYIGRALDVGQRWQSHQEEWKKEIYKIGVREYPDAASMDIFERYYIARFPTTYNVAQLNNGYTSVDVLDNSELTIYSLDEFKKKFVFQGSLIHKNPRINMAFYGDNLDYVREAAYQKRISITEYVNQLIAEDKNSRLERLDDR